MRRSIHLKLFLPCLLLFAIILFQVSKARAEEESLSTLYASIYSKDPADLHGFGRKLGGSGALLSSDNPRSLPLIKENVDRIVFRVKTLLDMHPPEMRFSIRVYPAYRDISEVYREFGLIGDAPIAFYSHRTRTIYLALDRLNDRVFAHEVAHAVINHYFTAPPPAQVQEILAQYVDRHLWDE